MNIETTPRLPKPEQKPLDEIATLIQSLTYGEMMELSETIWRSQPEGSPVTQEDLPALLHRWAVSRAATPHNGSKRIALRLLVNLRSLCWGTQHARLRFVRMSAGRDDFKDSYYLRAIRTGIGSGLRNHYAPVEPLPDRLEKLLEKLKEAVEKGAASGATSENTPDQSTSDPEPAPDRR